MLRRTPLAHPVGFAVLFFLFIIVGVVANYVMSDLGYDVSLRFAAYVLTGIAFYALGTRIRIPPSPRALLALSLILLIIATVREHGPWAFVSAAIVAAIYWQWNTLRPRLHLASIAGIMLLAANLFVTGAVPLLEPTIRFSSQTIAFVFGYSLLFIGVAFTFPRDRRLAVALTVCGGSVLMLYGFRSYLLVLVLLLGISWWMQGRASARTGLGAVAVVCIIIVGIGYVTTLLLPQQWHLLPHELVAYRIGFTTHMLDIACREAGWWGIFHGSLWTHAATSPIVGSVVAGEGNITTTVIGPLILDGGILELSLMAVLGSVMATLYERARRTLMNVPYYAIAYAILLVSIEISPVPLIFVMALLALSLAQREDETGPVAI